MDWTSRIAQYSAYIGTSKETEVPRHGGKLNVAYLDGHVSAMTASAFHEKCYETTVKPWWNDFWSGAHPW